MATEKNSPAAPTGAGPLEKKAPVKRLYCEDAVDIDVKKLARDVEVKLAKHLMKERSVVIDKATVYFAIGEELAKYCPLIKKHELGDYVWGRDMWKTLTATGVTALVDLYDNYHPDDNRVLLLPHELVPDARLREAIRQAAKHLVRGLDYMLGEIDSIRREATDYGDLENYAVYIYNSATQAMHEFVAELIYEYVTGKPCEWPIVRALEWYYGKLKEIYNLEEAKTDYTI